MMRLAASLALCLLAPAGTGAFAAGLDLDDTPLVTAAGSPVTFSPSLFDAAATVISFTFSGCQSVCPMSDVIMNDLASAAAAADVDVALVTITLDPINDTPEVLAAHRRKYGFPAHTEWRWLTGDPDAVFNVLNRLGMRVGSLADHPSFFVIVGRGGTQTQSQWEATATTTSLLEAVKAMGKTDAP